MKDTNSTIKGEPKGYIHKSSLLLHRQRRDCPSRFALESTAILTDAFSGSPTKRQMCVEMKDLLNAEVIYGGEVSVADKMKSSSFAACMNASSRMT